MSHRQRQKAKRLGKQLAALNKDQLDDRTTCLMCKRSFDSRNALFSHLESCTGKAAKGRARG